MPYASYIVSAKVHHREPNGESRMDGSELSFNYIEILSFSAPRTATMEEIFNKVESKVNSGNVIEVTLSEDLSTYQPTPPSEHDF